MTKPDSLIFDMDGTLWDASETYLAAWNKGFKAMNINKSMNRGELDHMMGWEKRKVMEHTFPEYPEEMQEKIFDAIVAAQDSLIPKLGGKLYQGVAEGIARLSEKYKLFILSNCPKDTIKQFLEFTNLTPYITDEMAHGFNHKPKHHNINLLIKKHNLENPVYIGDTKTDQGESELAGLPFIFVDYSFGKADNYDLKFSSFTDLTNHFMQM